MPLVCPQNKALVFILACIGTELSFCLTHKPIVLPNLEPFGFLVSAVGKAFAAATVIVFGSATLVLEPQPRSLDMLNVRFAHVSLFLDKYF